jgi:hypothetical protein
MRLVMILVQQLISVARWASANWRSDELNWISWYACMVSGPMKPLCIAASSQLSITSVGTELNGIQGD